ncbi:hypothetical protein GCM10008959_00620 [Deinococcus seoulensis]|uniref:DUF2259 domain-containing protein n=2 Tax=Deinococcus seoulensis TaxID=1837379 RepID=A0ABQ2RN42_9DEIO|nr:hypothetical protein GCM10008959_00620 [Deinococcus seoulensis]
MYGTPMRRLPAGPRSSLLVPLTLWAALSGGAHANERLPVTEVRFSASGERVMAFLSGQSDGSGVGTARLDVLNTRTGQTLLGRAGTVTDGGEAQAVRAVLNTPSTPATLRSAGLTGRPASVPRYRRTYPVPYPRWEDAVTAGRTQITPVRLWTVPVPVRLNVYAVNAPCSYPDMLPPGIRPAGFSLRVNGQVVHTDPLTPAGPATHPLNCAAGYTVERVDVQGNRVLVTLRALIPGFEGPDAVPMFVAALLR